MTCALSTGHWVVAARLERTGVVGRSSRFPASGFRDIVIEHTLARRAILFDGIVIIRHTFQTKLNFGAPQLGFSLSVVLVGSGRA